MTTRRLVADAQGIAEAAGLLRTGRLVAFPTETVYGLGGDATDERAIAAIFAAKQRPRFNPLIVHLPDPATAEALAVLDDRARTLAERFWPGPLTLVLPRRADCPIARLASAGLDTLALRVPAHPVARALLLAVGRPLAGPSANPSGTISPTTADHVLDGLDGRIDAVLDGGPCAVGIESTIVDLSERRAALLRPGGLPAAEIEALIGPLERPGAEDRDAPRSPGRMLRHYAPGRPVRLEARAAQPGEALLGFGPAAPPDCLNLSPGGDLVEAAAHLFAYLRRLDRPEVAAIAVMPIPEHGLGAAINDRLRRAAEPANIAP